MSDVSSVYSSSSRITGLFSQLDTDTIIEDLLKVGQSKIDGKDQDKTVQEWHYDAIGDIQKLVEEFKNNYLSALGENSMLSSATYKSYSAVVSDTSAVSISTTSGALTGSYTIDSITQLAENASVSSLGRISSDGTSISSSNTTALKNLDFAVDLQFDDDDQISFAINDVEFMFDADTTLQTMINTINADKAAGVTMKYSRLTDAFSITADEGGAVSSVTIENISGNAFGTNSAFGIGEGTTGDIKAAAVTSSNSIVSDGSSINRYSTLGDLDTAMSNGLFGGESEISFSINGETFAFDATTNILDMMYAVNSSAAGVTMTFNSAADTFAITSDDAGEDAEITITNITGSAFGADGAFDIDEGTVYGGTYGQAGQDASCSIEGVTVTRDSNEFTIDGITYSLNQTTDEAVGFTISRDFTTTVDAIKTFVAAYNEVTEKLNDLLDEKDYSADYKPLTSEQEEEMTESQLEKWNEKAMSGVLRNNDDIESFLRSIKKSFFTSLGGMEQTMASIGITTASYFSDDAGKIVIDEDALTAALEANPETVISMFTESADGAKGLIYQLADTVNSYVDILEDDEDSTAEKIDDLEEKIVEMEDDLDAMAERYYKKFAIMEQALAKLNSMSGMLSSLFNA